MRHSVYADVFFFVQVSQIAVSTYPPQRKLKSILKFSNVATTIIPSVQPSNSLVTQSISSITNFSQSVSKVSSPPESQYSTGMKLVKTCKGKLTLVSDKEPVTRKSFKFKSKGGKQLLIKNGQVLSVKTISPQKKESMQNIPSSEEIRRSISYSPPKRIILKKSDLKRLPTFLKSDSKSTICNMSLTQNTVDGKSVFKNNTNGNYIGNTNNKHEILKKIDLTNISVDIQSVDNNKSKTTNVYRTKMNEDIPLSNNHKTMNQTVAVTESDVSVKDKLFNIYEKFAIKPLDINGIKDTNIRHQTKNVFENDGILKDTDVTTSLKSCFKDSETSIQINSLSLQSDIGENCNPIKKNLTALETGKTSTDDNDSDTTHLKNNPESTNYMEDTLNRDIMLENDLIEVKKHSAQLTCTSTPDDIQQNILCVINGKPSESVSVSENTGDTVATLNSIAGDSHFTKDIKPTSNNERTFLANAVSETFPSKYNRDMSSPIDLINAAALTQCAAEDNDTCNLHFLSNKRLSENYSNVDSEMSTRMYGTVKPSTLTYSHVKRIAEPTKNVVINNMSEITPNINLETVIQTFKNNKIALRDTNNAAEASSTRPCKNGGISSTQNISKKLVQGNAQRISTKNIRKLKRSNVVNKRSKKYIFEKSKRHNNLGLLKSDKFTGTVKYKKKLGLSNKYQCKNHICKTVNTVKVNKILRKNKKLLTRNIEPKKSSHEISLPSITDESASTIGNNIKKNSQNINSSDYKKQSACVVSAISVTEENTIRLQTDVNKTSENVHTYNNSLSTSDIAGYETSPPIVAEENTLQIDTLNVNKTSEKVCLPIHPQRESPKSAYKRKEPMSLIKYEIQSKISSGDNDAKCVLLNAHKTASNTTNFSTVNIAASEKFPESKRISDIVVFSVDTQYSSTSYDSAKENTKPDTNKETHAIIVPPVQITEQEHSKAKNEIVDKISHNFKVDLTEKDNCTPKVSTSSLLSSISGTDKNITTKWDSLKENSSNVNKKTASKVSNTSVSQKASFKRPIRYVSAKVNTTFTIDKDSFSKKSKKESKQKSKIVLKKKPLTFNCNTAIKFFRSSDRRDTTNKEQRRRRKILTNDLIIASKIVSSHPKEKHEIAEKISVLAQGTMKPKILMNIDKQNFLKNAALAEKCINIGSMKKKLQASICEDSVSINSSNSEHLK